MKCISCGKDKLSNEFPLQTLTDKCDHPALSCLRCCLDEEKRLVGEYISCAHQGCSEKLKRTDAKIALFQALIDKQFPKPYAENDISITITDQVVDGAKLVVKNMVGQQHEVKYSKELKIRELKKSLKKEFHLSHDPSKLVLKYGKSVLKDFHNGGAVATLGSHKVPENAILHMAVVLFSVDPDMEEVLLDMFWKLGAPGILDYVDISCILYAKKEPFDTVSFEAQISQKGNSAVEHSSDKIDRKRRVGMHIIDVHLKKLPSEVDQIFFVVSTWNDEPLSKYKPFMKFYDARDIFHDLCSMSLESADDPNVRFDDKSACILCYLVRDDDGSWQVEEVKLPSNATVKNFNPIKAEIKKMFQDIEQ